MIETKSKPRTWGFQFSLKGAAAINVFAGVAVVFWRFGNPLWWMLVIAAGHFFLFCNLFRIIRRRELIWAGLFIINITLLLFCLCRGKETLWFWHELDYLVSFIGIV